MLPLHPELLISEPSQPAALPSPGQAMEFWEGRQAENIKSEFLLRSETDLLDKKLERQSTETVNPTSWTSRGILAQKLVGRNLFNKIRVLEEGGAASSEVSAKASCLGQQSRDVQTHRSRQHSSVAKDTIPKSLTSAFPP